jgi:hypothetical protein
MLKTTSQLLSHYQSIEEQNANIYNVMAKSYPKYKEVFNKLGKESLEHIDITQRAYREGVTDAFEVGFLANPIDPEKYLILEPIGNFEENVRVLSLNEETIIKFYLDAASNSSRLLPDLSETFERLIKRKRRNIEKLREIDVII